MSDINQMIIERIREMIRLPTEIEVNGESFAVRNIYELSDWQQRTAELVGHEWEFDIGETVFAEDDCGNYFTINGIGHTFFLDHETDERIPVSNSLYDFAQRLVHRDDRDMPKPNVISTWKALGFEPKFD